MPAPGDQHTNGFNPFIAPSQRISEYTAQEIATLQARLDKQLGPEYLSSRSGPGGSKVHYITADKCIALANEVFGFNGWSSSIENITTDYVDENPRGVSVGLSVVVRVTLRDGTYHEDIGYGNIDNARGKAAAFEKAKKEGTTDALKRALRQFGNVLGNCVYDKSYLTKVTRIKAAPTKFDENALHRHGDFVKKEPVESEMLRIEPAKPPPQLPTSESFEDFLGELDEADFNISEEGHPDEVILPNSNQIDSNQNNQSDNSRGNNPMQPPARPLVRTGSTGNNPPRQQPQTPMQQAARPGPNAFPGAQNHGPPGGVRPPQQQFNQNRPAAQNPQTHMTPPHAANGNPTEPGGEPVGFFSARAVKEIPEESLIKGKVAPMAGQSFNPRLESPSIRKTPGVDHSTSKPLSRDLKPVPPPPLRKDGDDKLIGNLSGPKAGLGAVNRPGQPQPQPPQHPQQQQQQQQQQQPPRPGPGHAIGRPANMVNPQLDQTRRIGAPGALSPLANRGQYRPPTMKRPAGGDIGAPNGGAGGGGTAARAPLTDMSNTTGVPVSNVAGKVGVGNGVMGGDLKRQRTS